jgi:preprotein translocase subunit YajC
MFIPPAYAQDAAAAGSSGLMQILPLILIFVVFYFLLIRPQQKKAKEHRAMIDSVRRGDSVITGGGIMGKVAKVNDDGSVEVDIAENVRIKVLKGTISEVRTRGEPAPGHAKPAAAADKPKNPLSSLFGGKK